jgi:hypothetical protein
VLACIGTFYLSVNIQDDLNSATAAPAVANQTRGNPCSKNTRRIHHVTSVSRAFRAIIAVSARHFNHSKASGIPCYPPARRISGDFEPQLKHLISNSPKTTLSQPLTRPRISPHCTMASLSMLRLTVRPATFTLLRPCTRSLRRAPAVAQSACARAAFSSSTLRRSAGHEDETFEEFSARYGSD